MAVVLALETSTAYASVAVCEGNRVLSTEASPLQRTHSEFLNPAIERCLKEAGLRLEEVNIFAAGSGPGSFTGLRVAANVAKTFSMVFAQPLVTLDSLTLLMMEARSRGAKEEKILCLLNAYKNMTFTALFLDRLLEVGPTALTLPDLESLHLNSSEPVLCVGEGFSAYERFLSSGFKDQLKRDRVHTDFPLATTLGLAAENLLETGQTIEWNFFEPLYIRASEAEENLRKKGI